MSETNAMFEFVKAMVNPTAIQNDFNLQNAAAPQKADMGKVQLQLVPPSLVQSVGQILTFGAKKYAPGAWLQNPMDWSRVIGAMDRHWQDWKNGINTDAETGFSQLWHVGCNIAFLIEYEMYGLGKDDRYFHFRPLKTVEAK